MEDGVIVLVVVLIAAVIYFVPAMVAWSVNHRNFTAILLLNLFLGWLIVGWVVALVWAVLAPPEGTSRRGRYRAPQIDPPAPYALAAVMYTCPHCSASNSVAAELLGRVVVCAACGRPFTATA